MFLSNIKDTNKISDNLPVVDKFEVKVLSCSKNTNKFSEITFNNTYVIMNDDLIETYNKNRFIYDNQNYIF